MPRQSTTLDVVDELIDLGYTARPDGSGIWVEGHGKVTVGEARVILKIAKDRDGQ